MKPEREIPVRIIIRRKGHKQAHHGGAWKVAFADFMTAMFALFLVLWLVNQSTDIKSAIAGYFQDPLGRADEFASSIMPGQGAQTAMARPLTPSDVVDLRRDRLAETAKRIEQRMAAAPDLAALKNNISVTVTKDGLRIELLEDSTSTFFQTGRSDPSTRGREVLTLLGSELGALPFPIVVDGYTDARPYSGFGVYSNWELSADRANTARRIMTRFGLAPGQITQIRGHADRDPLLPEAPLSPRNRRITITMLLTGADPGSADADSVATPVPPDTTATPVPEATP